MSLVDQRPAELPRSRACEALALPVRIDVASPGYPSNTEMEGARTIHD
jgi:hypothetical protein